MHILVLVVKKPYMLHNYLNTINTLIQQLALNPQQSYQALHKKLGQEVELASKLAQLPISPL